MEIIRRVIYYGSCLIAIVLAFYTDLSPVVIIDIFNPEKDTRSQGRRYAESLLSEGDQRDIAQRLKKEIETNTITVKADGWTQISKNLKALKDGSLVPEDYKKRLPSDNYPMSLFFFRTNESPISELTHYLTTDAQRVYIRIDQTNQQLRLDYRIYKGDDFHLGTGLSRYPRPPTWMLYPYRQYSLWIALIGILTYLFLPIKDISPKALRYPRWRVILGDFAASILTFMFFSMPFFIIGSAQQTLNPWILFSGVFWGISLLGIYSIKIVTWYGSYQIDILEDGIKVADYRGIRQIRYDEMEYFQPVIFKPPRWLVILTWIAALSGRGGAGRAMLLSTSETGSIGIRLRDGRDLFIVVTDQMGTTAMKGFEKIIDRLRSLKVKELDEIREIRSMGFEVMR